MHERSSIPSAHLATSHVIKTLSNIPITLIIQAYVRPDI